MSLNRIQAFLTSHEIAPKDAAAGAGGAGDKTPGAVQLLRGSFFWDDQRQKPALTDVTMAVQPGKFACVIGETGSGKSALLK